MNEDKFEERQPWRKEASEISSIGEASPHFQNNESMQYEVTGEGTGSSAGTRKKILFLKETNNSSDTTNKEDEMNGGWGFRKVGERFRALTNGSGGGVKEIPESEVADNPPSEEFSSYRPPTLRRTKDNEVAIHHGPHIHMSTFIPEKKNVGRNSNLLYDQIEYEDVYAVSQRAQNFISEWTEAGVPTSLLSIHTTTISTNPALQIAGRFSSIGGSFQQVVRIWYHFNDEHTVTLTRLAPSAVFGMKNACPPVTDEEDSGKQVEGRWITFRALPSSPCAEAGLPVDRDLILTHINGLDVCPAGCRSTSPRASGGCSWEKSVVPLLVSDVLSCSLTYI